MSSQKHPPHPASTAAGALHGTIGKHLPDLILGAMDGVITTLAVVAGVAGASLSPAVLLILGFANLLADGFSMGASNVLSRRSDPQRDELPTLAAATSHGVATFLGFAGAGFVPLLAYLLPWFESRFATATVLGLATLFAVGAGRASFTKRSWIVSGLEMLLLGALAAAVAYGVGVLGGMVVENAGL
jgi:VIT1/CCC1 family predicted Fe2+/Mn2+ transporter